MIATFLYRVLILHLDMGGSEIPRKRDRKLRVSITPSIILSNGLERPSSPSISRPEIQPASISQNNLPELSISTHKHRPFVGFRFCQRQKRKSRRRIPLNFPSRTKAFFSISSARNSLIKRTDKCAHVYQSMFVRISTQANDWNQNIPYAQWKARQQIRTGFSLLSSSKTGENRSHLF